MQTYEQKFFDDTNALRDEIAQLLEDADDGDTDAQAKLAEINEQISYKVLYRAYVELECETTKYETKSFDTKEEYKEFYEENDGCTKYESDLDIDAEEDDPYGQVSVGDLEYNVYGLKLAETASEDARIVERKKLEMVNTKRELVIVERNRAELEEKLAEVLKREEELKVVLNVNY